MIKLELGMPHLNYNGIDPVWLAKTLAEEHWSFLKDISSINEYNQRLYASMFYFNVNFNAGQNSFKEFNEAVIESNILKFNNQIYKSLHTISSGTITASATLESIFVKKDLDSGILIRDNPIESKKEFETTREISLEEHKKLKKEYANIDTKMFNELVFSSEAYFNGVKLLYFANYLNLVYLNEYITYKSILNPIEKLEIYYFSNINPYDKVYGYTQQKNNVYETILASNNKLMSVCKITR